ncbi:hypothetical protein KC338_g16 [Hortaea werneckii]|nr:hypothetical protein KC338_g16 [Hortaea werneckii]
MVSYSVMVGSALMTALQPAVMRLRTSASSKVMVLDLGIRALGVDGADGDAEATRSVGVVEHGGYSQDLTVLLEVLTKELGNFAGHDVVFEPAEAVHVGVVDGIGDRALLR